MIHKITQSFSEPFYISADSYEMDSDGIYMNFYLHKIEDNGSPSKWCCASVDLTTCAVWFDVKNIDLKKLSPPPGTP